MSGGEAESMTNPVQARQDRLVFFLNAAVARPGACLRLCPL
jgi:hypothetical protein